MPVAGILLPMGGSSGSSTFGAWIEGLCLISTLGLLLFALFMTRGAMRAGAEDAVEEAPVERASEPPPPMLVAPPSQHLVIVVDEGPDLRDADDFARALDLGVDAFVTVEVVGATDTMLRGLEEALMLSAACVTSDCTRLAVLDLRLEAAPR